MGCVVVGGCLQAERLERLSVFQVADDASLIGRSGYLWQELLSHSLVNQATARPDSLLGSLGKTAAESVPESSES